MIKYNTHFDSSESVAIVRFQEPGCTSNTMADSTFSSHWHSWKWLANLDMTLAFKLCSAYSLKGFLSNRRSLLKETSKSSTVRENVPEMRHDISLGILTWVNIFCHVFIKHSLMRFFSSLKPNQGFGYMHLYMYHSLDKLISVYLV